MRTELEEVPWHNSGDHPAPSGVCPNVSYLQDTPRNFNEKSYSINYQRQGKDMK